MTELKLDSRSIDPIQLRTYEAIIRVATEGQVPFIIVGASACTNTKKGRCRLSVPGNKL